MTDPIRQYDADGNVVWEGYPPEDRDPVVCSEFLWFGEWFQTVWWPDSHLDPGHWQVVRRDDPHIWRVRQTFSENFNG